MHIRELTSGEESRWDEFVYQSEFSTPQLLSAWKQVMEVVFDSDTHYLLAEENDHIIGVLPLIHVKSLITGHYLTSFPGGLCAKDNESAGLLLDHAKDLVRATNARYLILRDSRRRWNLPDLVTDVEHVTFSIEVHSDLDEIKSTMKKRTRQLVNQVSNNGLKVERGWNHFREYYPIYSRAMQDFGNPTLGYKFFHGIETHLPGGADLITLQYNGRVVGGGFFSPFNQTVYCLWSGLLREYYDLHTSYSLSWASIKYAHDNGYRWVDFGRCRKNSGGYQFKKGFGGQMQQLYQQIYLNGINEIPRVGAELHEDFKFRIFVALWRMLPNRLTEILGPELRKQMPFG